LIEQSITDQCHAQPVMSVWYHEYSQGIWSAHLFVHPAVCYFSANNQDHIPKENRWSNTCLCVAVLLPHLAPTDF
jgi:hypothetical protein